jgi:hypothetical protein
VVSARISPTMDKKRALISMDSALWRPMPLWNPLAGLFPISCFPGPLFRHGSGDLVYNIDGASVSGSSI